MIAIIFFSHLKALHKQGKATADHTTLLLNCFTRLDKTDQVCNRC